MFQQSGSSAQRAARSLHVKSALNPMLWLTGIATPIFLCGAVALKESSPVFEILVGFGVLPAGVTCLGFMYFALFKSEKLQSEDYQIRHESLQIIQQKTGTIEIPYTSLENIVNPQARQLTNRGEK
ncbi:TPA: hypothetical protein ACMDRZ_003780 [Vibrio cholerae]|uniref:hypothetical protein n=1 Tax=Vibrio TaxID=662 RepID=UPI0006D78CD5|nr:MULTISPECIES: hypothetical protein [Vibrio]EHD2271059.1 hypothetical protein [Vibrio cholerae]EIC2299121.1 hypothetical protein [Vibrio cholerae]EIJ2221373.1 hypothetical protein [Vibrio cholerae]EJL6912833.1 hypothetical protein [Vibrio cholerae]EJL6998656.1 hypothetical protein [Vibrio cholerae]